MYQVTSEMMDAFWQGAYMAIYPVFGVVAWTLVARLVNSSLD